jgi:hypothetical protein
VNQSGDWSTLKNWLIKSNNLLIPAPRLPLQGDSVLIDQPGSYTILMNIPEQFNFAKLVIGGELAFPNIILATPTLFNGIFILMENSTVNWNGTLNLGGMSTIQTDLNGDGTFVILATGTCTLIGVNIGTKIISNGTLNIVKNVYLYQTSNMKSTRIIGTGTLQMNADQYWSGTSTCSVPLVITKQILFLDGTHSLQTLSLVNMTSLVIPQSVTVSVSSSSQITSLILNGKFSVNTNGGILSLTSVILQGGALEGSVNIITSLQFNGGVIQNAIITLRSLAQIVLRTTFTKSTTNTLIQLLDQNCITIYPAVLWNFIPKHRFDNINHNSSRPDCRVKF